jgi:hypothetical protein
MPRSPAHHRNKSVEEAIRLLESHPDFRRVQVLTRDRLQEAEMKVLVEARVYGSRARLGYILKRFDIRSEAFLELISDIAMQNAYMVVVEHLVREAWEEHTGLPPEQLRPASEETEEDARAIEARKTLWVTAGYKRLAYPDQQQTSDVENTSLEPLASAVAVAGTRRAAVDAYIAEVRQNGKEITRSNIWKAAGYGSRREFERWERNDSERQNKTADRRISQVLREKPHLKKI